MSISTYINTNTETYGSLYLCGNPFIPSLLLVPLLLLVIPQPIIIARYHLSNCIACFVVITRLSTVAMSLLLLVPSLVSSLSLVSQPLLCRYYSLSRPLPFRPLLSTCSRQNWRILISVAVYDVGALFGDRIREFLFLSQYDVRFGRPSRQKYVKKIGRAGSLL